MPKKGEVMTTAQRDKIRASALAKRPEGFVPKKKGKKKTTAEA
jgi:hypothetical protein